MFTRWILLFTLAISSWLFARASFVQTAKSNYVEKFTKTCPSDGIPVCAARGKDYFLLPNECWLHDVNAEDLFGLFGSLKKVPIIFCIRHCHLMCPEVIEPICALNVKTQKTEMFRNMCKLVKYSCNTNMEFQQLPLKNCEPPNDSSSKTNVRYLTEVLPNSKKAVGKRSRKTKKMPIPCTGAFKPVCGLYKGVKSTFKNECLLNAENVKFGKDWRIIKNGICDEDYLSVRRNPKNKPQQGHSVRRRSYGHNPNYMNFHNRNAEHTAPFKPDITFSSTDLLKYMPDLYHSQADIANSVLRQHNANNIMQQFLTLPAPSLDENASQEKDRPLETERHRSFVLANDKAFQYRTKNYNEFFNGIDSKPNGIQPAASLGFERRELLAPVSGVLESNKVLPEETEDFKQNYELHPMSHALDINAYEEKKHMNDDNDYYFETYNVDFPATTEPSMHFENVQHADEKKSVTTPLPRTTTDQDTIFVISRRPTAKNVASNKIIENTKTSNIESSTKKTSVKTTRNKSKIENSTKKSNIFCKFGNEPICGVLANGTVRTFASICEMTNQNAYLKKHWVKLHKGRCEKCQNKCSHDYKPICVQRNGVNYTMVNECYFNMGICLDKRSNWKHIADGACKRFNRIPDKYENIQHGFQYTSKHFATPSTQVITTTMPTPTTEIITTVEPQELTTGYEITSSTTTIASSSVKQTEDNSTEASHQDFTSEDEQSVSSIASSWRKSKKRNKVSKRKIETNTHPAENTNFKVSEESYVMDLTKGSQNSSS